MKKLEKTAVEVDIGRLSNTFVNVLGALRCQVEYKSGESGHLEMAEETIFKMRAKLEYASNELWNMLPPEKRNPSLGDLLK